MPTSLRTNFAIPSGRIRDALAPMLQDLGYWSSNDTKNSRQLIAPARLGNLNIVDVKPSDVPKMVADGGVAFGICGPDVWDENKFKLGSKVLASDIILPGPRLRFSIIGTDQQRKILEQAQDWLDAELAPTFRVATAYPELTKDALETAYVTEQAGRIAIEISSMAGKVELAPILQGLLATDLVETGQTLRQNGLAELQTLRMWQGYRIIINKNLANNPDVVDALRNFSRVECNYEFDRARRIVVYEECEDCKAQYRTRRSYRFDGEGGDEEAPSASVIQQNALQARLG